MLYIYDMRCIFAALTYNDVCHRRLSVGYPLETMSGFFYARLSADRRLPFRYIHGAPSEMTLVVG